MVDALHIAMVMFGALCGAIVGSFCATYALRFARGEQAFAGRSHCDHCQTSLTWTETVPVISYLTLRGKCRHCQGVIDKSHVVIEAFSAIMVGASIFFLSPAVALVMSLLGLALLTHALIDFKTYRLPDHITLIVATACLCIAIINNLWLEGLIASLISLFILLTLKYGLELRHKQTMLGLGDIKLVAALALFVGSLTPLMMVFASVLALLQHRIWQGQQMSKYLAFGPAIAISGFLFCWVHLIFPELSS